MPVAEIALPACCYPLLSEPGVEGFQWVGPDLFIAARARARIRDAKDSLGVNAYLDDLRHRQHAIEIFAV